MLPGHGGIALANVTEVGAFHTLRRVGVIAATGQQAAQHLGHFCRERASKASRRMALKVVAPPVPP